jgi:TolB-like protein/tetratricopeptide (TPR) repeat protein/DNA-binding winged helix-turn-helix (wHTH) protein
MAMDAGGLQDGFCLGEWLIEPRGHRVSGPGASVVLTEHQMEILLCLAEHHGEVVDGKVLRDRAWPGQISCDERLRESVAALRALLGDTPKHCKYIVSAGHDGYALIAHFEPVPPVASNPPAPVKGQQLPTSLAGRLQWLIVEFRRRHVLHVTGTYLVGMWIMLQVAEVTFGPLRLPEWWMTALTILAVIGLPIVMTTAWLYEITPGGIVLDPGEGAAAVRLPRPRRSVAPVLLTGVALMAAVTGLAWWRSIQAPSVDAAPATEPGAQSIAVLPLVDMSPGGGNTYLGDGLSEELSMRLAQVPGLRVAARTSAFEFKDKSMDVRRIGQSLGVRHVLEGSVRRDGDSLRVTVQLIDARTGYHVWSGNYDRGWRDVLDLQDDIARSVTDALKIVLSANDAAKPVTPTKFDVRAIDPYLAGLALLRQPGDLSRLQQAARFFSDAIAIEPSLAGAHAGLCRVGARSYDRTRDPAELEAGERSCRIALNLDASLIDTEKALAGLYISGGKFAQAEAMYRALLKRSPQDADVHIGLGEALEGSGRGNEAEASFRQAVAAEPAFWGAHNALATHFFQRGRIADATAEYRKVTELMPSSASAWSSLGGSMQMGGDFKGAADAYRRSLLLEPSKAAYSNLATMHFYLGQFPEAVQHFESAVALGEHDQVVWGNLADALWQIDGRRDEAVRKYRRAIELAETELAATPGDPTLRAQLGYYYGRTGAAERAQTYLAQAVATGADKLYVQYYRAVAAVDRGDRAAALQALTDLVGLGYPKVLLRSAPEFRSLLQDRRYKEIAGVS